MKKTSSRHLKPILAFLFLAAWPAGAREPVVSFDDGIDVRDILTGLRESSSRMAAVKGAAQDERRVLLTDLKPGAMVTLSRALSEQIARDDSSFSLTTFINGIKVDLENLTGAVGASLLPGPGLWAAVNTVPDTARGKCAAVPAATVLSLVAVSLSETSGNGASLILDFGGQACVESITLRIINGASRAPHPSGVTVGDLEETFGFDADGVPRLKVAGRRSHGPL